MRTLLTHSICRLRNAHLTTTWGGEVERAQYPIEIRCAMRTLQLLGAEYTFFGLSPI